MKSLCCLLAVIPSGENTRDAPTCRRRRRRKDNGQAASAVYGKLGFSGAPCAGKGMRGFYETTPCLRGVGFLKCENRHF